jgi:crossover junction endodeoxyribonuclease RusA
VSYLDLPYPPAALSSNARGHWAKKAKVVKAYRRDCAILAKAAKLSIPPEITDKIDLHLTFFAPDKRRRDQDGAISRMKAGIDGIADALGIDDSRFRIFPHFSDATGGFVRVWLA